MRKARHLLSPLLVLFAGHAAAQTWTGSGADNNWSTGANWAGGVAPTSSSTTQLDFGFGASRLTPVVDAPWTINRMSVVAGGYSFSGQPITFAGVGPRLDLGITGTLTTISNAIVLGGRSSSATSASSTSTEGSAGRDHSGSPGLRALPR
jgi:hypothetical protein